MRSLSFIFVAITSLLLLGCEKYALDKQMEELCAKDGGIKVYEKVVLPVEMFDKNGYPFPSNYRTKGQYFSDESGDRFEEMLDAKYRYIQLSIYIKKGSPEKGEGLLLKSTEQVIRISDGKILAEGTRYGRSGGDFMAYAHFTSTHCPFGESYRGVLPSVFTKLGD